MNFVVLLTSSLKSDIINKNNMGFYSIFKEFPTGKADGVSFESIAADAFPSVLWCGTISWRMIGWYYSYDKRSLLRVC